MSKLTETVSFKVSKETKDFLSTLDNSSEFLRRMIKINQKIGDELSKIVSKKIIEGEEYIQFSDEDSLARIADKLNKSILQEVFRHSLNITDNKNNKL